MLELKIDDDMQPYIELPDREFLPKNYYDQIAKTFIDKALKNGLEIVKACDDKDCDRHWNIVLAPPTESK